MLGNGSYPKQTDKERVLNNDLVDMAERLDFMTTSRNFWKLKYHEQLEETRKSNRGVQRLSYWKQKNKDMMNSIRNQQQKHKLNGQVKETWIDRLVGVHDGKPS